MAEESDGIEEALESNVRLAAMAGARLGAEIARAHEDRLRERRRVDEREADRLTQRLEAEKRVAAAVPGQGRNPGSRARADATRIDKIPSELDQAREWAKANDSKAWDTYTADMMGSDGGEGFRMAERDLIRSWREAQPQAMTQEELDRVADRQRQQIAQEEAEAAILLANADLETSPAYDSADRRAADAAAMTATGIDPQVAESRMHADTAVASPATRATAVGNSARLAPKARTTRGRGSQVQHAGVER